MLRNSVLVIWLRQHRRMSPFLAILFPTTDSLKHRLEADAVAVQELTSSLDTDAILAASAVNKSSTSRRPHQLLCSRIDHIYPFQERSEM